MFGTALRYGAISGAIVVGVILAGILIAERGGGGHGFASEVFGYSVMIVALSMIFLAIRDYRNAKLGGVIKFLPAFGLGLLVAAIAGIVYAAVWEVYLAATHYTFMDNYAAQMIAAKRAAGVSGAELDAFVAQMNQMKEAYANPILRFGMTFAEIFPVGLIIALLSAAVLRNPKVLPARA